MGFQTQVKMSWLKIYRLGVIKARTIERVGEGGDLQDREGIQDLRGRKFSEEDVDERKI